MNTGFTNLLVTGATGNVGAAVMEALATTRTLATAAVTDPVRYTLENVGRSAVTLDFYDPATFAPALDGVDSIFLMRPPAISKVGPTLNRLITVAVERGVRHIIFLSVAGAETNKIVPHHLVETHLAQSGINHTILRPGFFANNLGDAYREDIRTDDRLFVPAGTGRVAFIDARDIAAIVAMIAQDPDEHVGKGYTLTGSVSYSFKDAAALLSACLNRSITYTPASIVGYFQHLRRRGLPIPQVLVQLILHVGLRKGSAALVDPTLARLLGRNANTLEDYITSHQKLWQ
jgi:uncharacterized protein YbjT (DUF2867 family)